MLVKGDKTEDHKDVVYKSYEEICAALGSRGISLETLEKLKQLEQEETKQIEARAIDVTPDRNSRER